jgi:hypothetical protein
MQGNSFLSNSKPSNSNQCYSNQSNSNQSNSKMKVVLAGVLCVALVATGCTAQWISVALADLPVLTQMALNITSLVVTLQSGQQISVTDAAAVQNISNEASQDLNLLQTLYNQYKASPDAATLQKIQGTIATINQNLPGLLAQVRVSDPVVGARITAGVNLILTTVQSFAALMPATVNTSRRVAGEKLVIPNASELKKQWNQQVCAPTGKTGLDAALAGCELR